MIPSSLSQAQSDPRLRGAPLAVYLWCLENLDPLDYRPVKILSLSTEMHLNKDTAIFALRRLCVAGYIAKGPRPHGAPRHYRLYASPVKAKAA